MTPEQGAELAGLNTTIPGLVRVLCFDDIAQNARLLYKSIYQSNPGRDERVR